MERRKIQDHNPDRTEALLNPGKKLGDRLDVSSQ